MMDLRRFGCAECSSSSSSISTSLLGMFKSSIMSTKFEIWNDSTSVLAMFSCPFKLLETALFNAYPTPRLALSSKLHKNINCKYLVLDSFLLDVVVAVRRGPFLAHISLNKEKLITIKTNFFNRKTSRRILANVRTKRTRARKLWRGSNQLWINSLFLTEK